MTAGSPGPHPAPIIGEIDDARLDDVRALVETNRRRLVEAQRGCVVAEGVPLVSRLSRRHQPRTLLVTTPAVERPDVVALIRHHPSAVALIDPALLDEAVGFRFRRGVIASFRRPQMSAVHDLAAKSGPLVLLEGLNDDANLGTICRTALAFDAAGVVLDPTSPDPFYRRVVRVSMGAVMDLAIARSEDWPSTLHTLRADRRTLVALTTNPAAARLRDAVREVAPNRAALLLGAESTGLADETIAAADVEATIPTSVMVDSLNVGHAAAIGLHLLSRVE